MEPTGSAEDFDHPKTPSRSFETGHDDTARLRSEKHVLGSETGIQTALRRRIYRVRESAYGNYGLIGRFDVLNSHTKAKLPN